MSERADVITCLAAGGLVVLPTETVYGLSVALSAGEAGLDRVRAAKGSPPGRPFILLASHPEAALQLWSRVSESARDLAARGWPGPLTMIGPAREGLPPGLLGDRGGEPTVSVRVPGDPWLLGLLAELGEPLVSTSANRAGAPPPVGFDQVELAALAPDLAVDRGRCSGGIPSTIIDVVRDPSVVVRQGTWSQG